MSKPSVSIFEDFKPHPDCSEDPGSKQDRNATKIMLFQGFSMNSLKKCSLLKALKVFKVP